MGTGHSHAPHGAEASPTRGQTDRRWLFAAMAVIVAFLLVEVVIGIAAHSLALLADAGHMLTDAVAIGVAVVAAQLVHRPARGAFTYGFARLDALSGQANGITLVLLACWFVVEAVRRLLDPGPVHGGAVTIVALLGVAVKLVATAFASRADRSQLYVRGVLAHLISDIWAFAATAIAGVVIVTTGWYQADAIASLIVAGVMFYTGGLLVRQAGRIFLEAAPADIDPSVLGSELAAIDGVAALHDLHVWEIGTGEPALSAHVLVRPAYDCHEVSLRMRTVLDDTHGIST